MVVASANTHKVAVSWFQTLNVVANGVLVLDYVTPHHTTEVVKITPLHCKQRTQMNNYVRQK